MQKRLVKNEKLLKAKRNGLGNYSTYRKAKLGKIRTRDEKIRNSNRVADCRTAEE